MPTAKAITFIVLAFILFLIAANLQSGWIYLISFYLLTEVLVSFLSSRKLLFRATIERILPRRAEANTPFLIGFKYEKAPDGFTVYEPCVKKRFILTGPEGKKFFQVQLNRGIYEFKEFVAETYLNGAFFKFKKTFFQPQNLIVWPEIDSAYLELSKGIFAGAMEDRSVQKKKGDEYSGIREYKQGDSLKKIHWKKSAQHRKLLVRDDVDAFSREVLIFIDNSLTDFPEAIDDLTAVARTIVEALIENRFSVKVVAYENSLPVNVEGDSQNICDFLAGLKPEKPRKIFTPDEKIFSTLILIKPTQETAKDLDGPVASVLIAKDEAGLGGSRKIDIYRKSGKRIWSF